MRILFKININFKLLLKRYISNNLFNNLSALFQIQQLVPLQPLRLQYTQRQQQHQPVALALLLLLRKLQQQRLHR